MQRFWIVGFGIVFSAAASFAAPGPASSSSNEPPQYDVMCRLKAKEVAAETYRGCVTEARTNQIDQLKKDYQEKLRAMKSNYEQELKRLGTGKSSAKNSPGKKGTPKKTAKNSKFNDLGDMELDLKPASGPMPDDSIMEIPEPTPIENVPSVETST